MELLSFSNLVYLATLVLVVSYLYVLYRRYQFWKKGRKEKRWDHLWLRIRGATRHAFAPNKIYSDRYVAVMHSLIFIGIIGLFVSIRLLALYDSGFITSQLSYSVFTLLRNIFGFLAIAGITMALWRRHIIKPPKIKTTFKDLLPLYLLLAVSVTTLLVEIFKYEVLWWAHIALIFSIMGYAPHSKLIHIILVPLNIFFRSLKYLGALDTPKLKEISGDFYWKDLLDLDACTECGACQEFCPTVLSQKPLSPKTLIQDLRKPSLAVSQETLWACTTCGFCESRCPIFVEHLRKVIGLRRHAVLKTNEFPKELIKTLKSLRTNANPFGLWQGSRSDWRADDTPKIITSEDEVEMIFWVGCSGAFDERVKKVSRALSKILEKSGISFGILGNEEKCCGDWVRRIGDENDIQKLARDNIETLKKYKFKKIVTFCPHCFHVLKNEYPDLGGNFEVLHHSQLLSQLIKEGKLILPQGQSEKVQISFHDSCYLGRYNNIYEQPREVLKSIPGLQLKELPLSKLNSFCCGAGGGRYWLEENIGERINRIRAREVRESGSSVLATGCPYCLAMMEEGFSALGAEIKVRDISELLSENAKDS